MNKSPAITRGAKKTGRAVIQMAAAGGITAFISELAGGLSATGRLTVAVVNMVLLTFFQNAAETAGAIPALLPTSGLVTNREGLVAKVVGTVDTTTGRKE